MLRVDGSFPLRSHVLYEGLRLPLGVASAGLAILSFMPDREIDDYLERVDLVSGFGPAHGPRAMRERIERTRRDGYSVNPGLIVEGSWGMAAPVLDAAERPVGALSLTGVEHRFDRERQPRIGALLRRAAHDLSLRLAHPARQPGGPSPD
jgi:DNA-binding IclR family transcriptional regulator